MKLVNRIMRLNKVTKAEAIEWHESRVDFADLMAATPPSAAEYEALARMRIHSMEWLSKNLGTVRPRDLQ